MATSTLHGTDAGFQYTPPAGVLTTHALRLPLREQAPTHTQTRRVRWALDKVSRAVVTIGSGAEEISAAIRAEDEPQKLKTLLRHALDGVPVTYFPSLAVPGTSFPCALVAIVGANDEDVSLSPDREGWRKGWWEVTGVWRRLDGGTWEGVI